MEDNLILLRIKNVSKVLTTCLLWTFKTFQISTAWNIYISSLNRSLTTSTFLYRRSVWGSGKKTAFYTLSWIHVFLKLFWKMCFHSNYAFSVYFLYTFENFSYSNSDQHSRMWHINWQTCKMFWELKLYEKIYKKYQ